jgi:predicted nucleic acid-binding Zn ribbon protein
MQPISQVLPRALVEMVRQAPLSAGKVDFAWRTAVGAPMARVTAVCLEEGTLLVETQSAQWSAAVMRASPMILSRLRSMLGDDAVHNIRLRR